MLSKLPLINGKWLPMFDSDQIDWMTPWFLIRHLQEVQSVEVDVCLLSLIDVASLLTSDPALILLKILWLWI